MVRAASAIGLAAALLAGQAARAETVRPPPIVVELFTSQSCSSCPPADALLAELARTRQDVLVLDLHVTYWDRLGWKDPYSLPAATERQRRYSALWGADSVYTPQLVAGGRHQAIGSDRTAVLASVAAAVADRASAVPLRVARDGDGLTVQAAAGSGAGTLLLVGFDPAHTTRIGGGENGGRTLTEVNVVRSIAPLGAWSGAPTSLHAAVPAGERVAVLLQAADGAIRGAALLTP